MVMISDGCAMTVIGTSTEEAAVPELALEWAFVQVVGALS